MTHHGWVHSTESEHQSEDTARFPFSRMMRPGNHGYHSHEISLLAGAFGPLHADDMRCKEDAPRPTQGNPDKAGMPSGFTFLGQFIDHDLTELVALDPALAPLPNTATVGRRHCVYGDEGAETCRNGRYGVFDLDSVYGLEGGLNSNLFNGKGLFRLDRAGTDIDRSGDARAIADPRNDENQIVVQVHVLFERLHNVLLAQKAAPTHFLSDSFNRTREQVIEVYHRIVLCDYLPRLVQKDHLAAAAAAVISGDALYSKMLEKVRLQVEEEGYDFAETVYPMPVEFAHAVFRLGHTQLRDGYKLNDDNGFPLFSTVSGESKDLRGDTPITDPNRIDWDFFFDFGTGKVIDGEPLDGELPSSLFRLPPPTIGDAPVALGERNIRRGIDFGLPSGQQAYVALEAVYGGNLMGGAMTLEQIWPSDLRKRYPEVVAEHPEARFLNLHAPLWYYIILEAGLLKEPHLGAVGGLIVAETMLGALHAQYSDAGAPGKLEEMLKRCKEADTETHEVGDVEDIHTMTQMINYILKAEGRGTLG